MQADRHQFRQGDAVQLALTGQVLEVTSIAVLVDWEPDWQSAHPAHHLRPATQPCCPLHGRNCEPEEACCGRCTETSHDLQGFTTGQHADGSVCSKPNLSATRLGEAVAPPPRPMLSEPDLMRATLRHVLAFGQPAEPDPATLRKYDTDPEFHAAVRLAAELYLWKLDRQRAEASG